jgi:hypothetical protein
MKSIWIAVIVVIISSVSYASDLGSYSNDPSNKSFFDEFGLALFFISCFAFILLFNLRYAYTHYGKYPSFEDYRTKYPDLVKQGCVECFKCGCNKIQVRGLWGPTDKKKTHSCITCGTPLYKSKH